MENSDFLLQIFSNSGMISDFWRLNICRYYFSGHLVVWKGWMWEPVIERPKLDLSWDTFVKHRMIAYVDCLSTEPAGKCWNRTYYEDEDELLPLYTRKLNLQPKTEGSLRRRLLTSKIHQQQDAIWAPKPWAGPPARKSATLQCQPNYTFSPPRNDLRGST